MLRANPNLDLAPSKPLRSWVGSVLFHAVLFVLLAYFLQTMQAPGSPEVERSAGIALKHQTSEGDKFDGEEETGESQSEQANPENSEVLDALPSESASAAASKALPNLQLPGASLLEGGGIGNAEGMTGGGGSRPKGSGGGKAEVNVFNTVGSGTKFVYVFDRSSSMDGTRLRAAKRELINSLKSLAPVHQFQIIFFNNEVKVFDLSGGQNRIAFSTDQNKELAARWVNGVTADGGTERVPALLAGLRHKPDVLFFLTDDDSAMTNFDLQKIRDRNSGTVINVIEFGNGTFYLKDNFLKQIADQNHGKYVYVNTKELER